MESNIVGNVLHNRVTKKRPKMYFHESCIEHSQFHYITNNNNKKTWKHFLLICLWVHSTTSRSAATAKIGKNKWHAVCIYPRKRSDKEKPNRRMTNKSKRWNSEQFVIFRLKAFHIIYKNIYLLERLLRKLWLTVVINVDIERTLSQCYECFHVP